MQTNRNWTVVLPIILLSLVLLAACSRNDVESANSPPALLLGGEDIPPPPPLDPAQVAEGEILYAQYCAACHKANGEGDPEWQTPNEDGSFKPPPHNNDGHTWHHADDLLLDLIANGSSFPKSQMTAFGDQLTDEEILAIVAYLKTWWGPEERAFQWQMTWQARQQE